MQESKTESSRSTVNRRAEQPTKKRHCGCAADGDPHGGKQCSMEIIKWIYSHIKMPGGMWTERIGWCAAGHENVRLRGPGIGQRAAFGSAVRKAPAKRSWLEPKAEP